MDQNHRLGGLIGVGVKGIDRLKNELHSGGCQNKGDVLVGARTKVMFRAF